MSVVDGGKVWVPMTTTFGCVMLWALVLPVFLIIWFLRAPAKTEVERWART